MELHSPDIVQVATESVQYVLKAPDFDFVVVSAACEHCSGRVEIDCAHGAIVLLESIQQSPNSIVPQLNRPTVKKLACDGRRCYL
jgi:hypothetical protein